MSLPLSPIYPLRNLSLCPGFYSGIRRGRVLTMNAKNDSRTPPSTDGLKTVPVDTVAHKQAPSASISSHKLNNVILQHPSAYKSYEVQLVEKVKSISRKMRKLRGNPMEELVMVDTIKRLGMDHLFQEEISEVLHRHYMECFNQSSALHEVSLRFRLLRQEGYNVSSHTFDGFLGQDRKFNEELGKDTQGIVSLFEASQMSMHGECILDEANVFSKRILSTSLEKLGEFQTKLVQNALKHPLQKTLARYTANEFLGMHSSAKGWRYELQELAKMDFNATRVIYQNEIQHISKWDVDILDMLPEYMKLCLRALFGVTEEISHQIWLKYGCNPKDSLQKAWTDLFDAFLVESKWFAEGYLPTTTEYLKVATVTSGIHVVLAHMYFLLGGGSNTYECDGNVLDNDYTKITTSTATILRLWDDFGSNEDEDQDGHDGSYIKCYINEQEGVSTEVARERVVDLISDAWKSLNQETMQLPSHPSPSMKAFTRGCLNLARMIPLMYDYDENHSLPGLEKFVTSLLHQNY